MKKFNIFLLMVLICTNLLAQVSKSVTIATAGTLGTTALTANELSTVTNLTIIGNLDARDFKTMRDNMPSLAVLNISAVSIKAYYGSAGTIYNSYSDYAAYVIPPYSFYDYYYSKSKTSLTSITLPNSITSIPSYAFRGCTGLTTVLMGTGVTSIGTSAFIGCTGLTSAPIGAGVTSIGALAYEGCSKIVSANIPNSVLSIGEWAFKNCSELSTVTMGTGATIIGANVFNSCTNLTSLSIGSGVTTIGDNAFGFCTGLTSVTIPNSVTAVGTYVFEYCAGLTTINIGTGLTTLSEGVFSNCGAVDAINCKKIVPPTVGLNCFFGVPTTAVLTVPSTSLAAYKVTTGWKDFMNSIKGDDPIITVQIGTGGAVSENSVTLVNGGTVNVTSGTTKTFTFVPSAGYEIATLTYDGVDVKSQITASQYTTPAVTATKILAVTFQKMQYSLSLKSAATGTMNLAVEYGSTPVFDFTPATNWKVNTVFYNDVDVTASLVNGAYTVPAITANALLNVSFVSTATNAPELVNSNVKVYSTQSEIIVEGTLEGESITLFTVNGKQIQSVKSVGERLVIPAQRDVVYLVKTSSKTYKVIL